MFFDHVEAIRLGIGAMNNDWKVGLVRQRHLLVENAMLQVARRIIVEVVESDLAPRDDFGMLRQSGQFIQMLLRYFSRFVRMYSDSGVNPIVLFGERQRSIQFLRARTSADSKQRGNAGGARAIKHSLAVFRKLPKINVRVRVNQLHDGSCFTEKTASPFLRALCKFCLNAKPGIHRRPFCYGLRKPKTHRKCFECILDGKTDGHEVTLSSLLLNAPTDTATETPPPFASQKMYSSPSMSIASRCDRIRLSFSIRRIDLSSFSKTKSG